MTLSVGTILKERYRIDGFLGQGGMGAVYRAWDTNLEIPVAVKENTIDASPESQRQFEREAQMLARLIHPNLARVIEHFVISGQGQYLVMDFIEGQSLKDVVEQANRPLSEKEAFSWVGQVCQALEYLHSQDPPVIHRDIKPQNIIITPQGKAVLVDFGIAKKYDANRSTTLGAKAVTPGYSPPEQYGQAITDVTADVYALGATLYNLLTGETPPDALGRVIQNTPLIPPSKINPQVKRDVEKVVMKSLATTTERRYQDVTQFYASLRKAVGEATVDKPSPSIWQSKGMLFGLGAIVLILAVVGLGLIIGSGRGNDNGASADTLPSIGEIRIEIDGQKMEDEGFIEVKCGTSPRLEVKVLDSNRTAIPASTFTYNWHFEPKDAKNEEKVDSSNNAIIYQSPCELDSQTVTVETLADQETLSVKSLLFDIVQ